MQALTLTGNGLLNRLIMPVTVVGVDGTKKDFPALIDTGATNTCISNEVASELGLIAVGKAENLTAGGRTTSNIYVTTLMLCDGRVVIENQKVISVNLTEQVGVEMLIGMDILIHGDFIITHKDGITRASFRVPSLLSTDFIPEVLKHHQFEEEKQRRAKSRRR